MQILGGKTQVAGREKSRDIPAGISLVVSGILLGTVTGSLEARVVSGAGAVQPSDKTLRFEEGKSQDAHVVLNFPAVTTWSFTFTSPDPETLKKTPFFKSSFQDGMRSYLSNPNNVSALSYAIASVNNSTPPSGYTSLVPEFFQFATFSKNQVKDDPTSKATTSISIFIKTKGGSDSGQKTDLQAGWRAQWNDNDCGPIPDGFSASLLFASDYVYSTMLAPGFSAGKWGCAQESSTRGIKLRATLYDDWYVGSYDFDFSLVSHADISSCTFGVSQFPLYVYFHQKSGRSSPEMAMLWKVEGKAHYENYDRNLRIGGGSGDLIYKWRLTDLNDTSVSQDIPTYLTLTDTEFKIDVRMDQATWRCDVDATRDTFMDIPPYQDCLNHMQTGGLKRVNEPKLNFPGIHFLRTTNLLTPERECIDFNEEIGIKLPHDMLLVGEVLSK